MTKTAVVTGAGSGIGRASALALGAAGYRVGLVGRRLEALEETASRGAAGGAEMTAFACDVSDPDAVTALFSDVERTFGRLDVLFNNAGANIPSTNFGDLTPEGWRKVVSVNLDGAFYVAHGAYNLMRRQQPQGGRIINNGSISAHVPRPGSAPYTASKHAITGLTRSISLDGRQYDIACGQIDIGNAASEMTDRMVGGVPQADGSMKPEPRMDVEHVARTVVLMADFPLETNVQFVTVMATKMPFVGRG
jgi:NAD(P)-dependent dehydrogenase (short-subunit alcohol dehydrogenase family)